MKKKDIILIAGVVVISAVFALILSSVIIGSPAKHPQEAEVVDAITTDFPSPDTKYFNSKAIDPTKIITIGNNANPEPFSATSN